MTVDRPLSFEEAYPEDGHAPALRALPDEREPDLSPRAGLGSGAELLDDVEAFLARFVAFPSEHTRVACTLWTAHAHGVRAFDSSPRLALLSPEPGSGKTRVLEVVELMVPGAMHVLSASTPAIFRTIEKQTTTLLLDEVDAVFGRRGQDPNNEDLRALLNAGHRAGATIPRCVGPAHEVRRFPVYAAVAMAGLGDLPDTLMTRAVVIRMRRRTHGEVVEPFRHRTASEAGRKLHDRLQAWVLDAYGALEEARPDMPDGIEDRPADVWEPLLAVADEAGGLWPSRARLACSALAGAAISREASLGVRLLSDLRDVFGDENSLHTVTILERLHKLDESPWSNLKGAPLDARGLAWRLGQYEVSSKGVKIDDKTLKGYQRADLWDAWERYCPRDDADSASSAREGLPGLPGLPDTPEVTEVTEVTPLMEGTHDYDDDVLGGES